MCRAKRWRSLAGAISMPRMDEKQLEDIVLQGTAVLEKLAEIDKVEEFFEAVDSDDFRQAARLMRAAGVDEETISLVIKKMASA